MDKHQLTQSLLEATVEHELKNIKQDPHRGIRKFADLGRQFAKGRFQIHFFTLFQLFLADPNSPYYDALQSLLSNVDNATLKHFGVNLAYNSWIYGAALMRKSLSDTTHNPSWILNLTPHNLQEAEFFPEKMRAQISLNQRNGIFSYYLSCDRCDKMSVCEPKILSIIREFSNSAFLLQLPSRLLQAAQLSQLRECPNLCLLLPYDLSDITKITENLRTQKILYAIGIPYNDTSVDSLLQESFLQQLLALGSIFLFFIADGTCSPSCRQKVDNFALSSRMQQRFPAIFSEWETDRDRINRILLEDRHPSQLSVPNVK